MHLCWSDAVININCSVRLESRQRMSKPTPHQPPPPPPNKYKTTRPQVKKLQEEKFKPLEQLTLEPYERDHAVVVATYRPIPKAKK